MIHLNIRSLVNKIELVRQILLNRKIDCFCISETWLNDLITDDLIQVDGYNLWRKDRLSRGGGICCYVNEMLDCEAIELPFDDTSELEFLGVKISSPKIRSVCCFTIYRPPNGKAEKALQHLSKLSDFTCNNWKGRTIYHGDFNINYQNNTCKWAKALKKWETKAGLVQLMKLPSRVSRVSSSQIDLCFTDLNHIADSGMINTNISDHFATFLIRKKDREKGAERILDVGHMRTRQTKLSQTTLKEKYWI